MLARSVGYSQQGLKRAYPPYGYVNITLYMHVAGLDSGISNLS